jgi:hypothetical protein
MTDTKIHIFYQFGDIDTIDVDSIANRWSIDDGLFIIDTRDGEPIFIGNMDSIVCIKVENSDSENFPKNKKGVIDSDLRISASIMREEYRNNPEFRQSVYDSIRSGIKAASVGTDLVKVAADTIFDYETDSNN